MKTRYRLLTACLTLCLVSCVITPSAITLEDGSSAYTMDCKAGLDKCHQAAANTCPNGYDIIEEGKHTTTVVPHYGEFPLTLTTDTLTVQCL